MTLSEERQSHIVHLVIDGIWNDDLVDYTDEEKAMRAGNRAMQQFMKECAEIDKHVQQKIASLKRGVVEGSPEWDILYSKYYEEEMQRRGNT
ncbi:MAG: DUF507 family protein [Bdellovibrionales bacterium]|nr:DUF507 family protein [Bdellovibrionales bacterium]